MMIVYVCNNLDCRTIWDADPGVCPRCLPAQGGWGATPTQVQPVRARALVSPAWPVTGELAPELEDVGARVEGMTGGTAQ